MKSMDIDKEDDRIQVSGCGRTVWVHGLDGSTVGRFSRVFGMDVHTTITDQLEHGAGQCLHCTHVAPNLDDWIMFCKLMEQHYQVKIPVEIMKF